MLNKVLIIILAICSIGCQQSLIDSRGRGVDSYSGATDLSTNSSDYVWEHNQRNDTNGTDTQTSTEYMSTSIEPNNKSRTGHTTDYSETTSTYKSIDFSPSPMMTAEGLNPIVFVWMALSVIFYIFVIFGIIIAFKMFSSLKKYEKYDNENEMTAMTSLTEVRELTNGGLTEIGRASLPEIPNSDTEPNIDETSIRSRVSELDLKGKSSESLGLHDENST